MRACREVLFSILDRSGLDRTDGRPLYAYRVTSIELEDLRAALKDRIALAGRLRDQVESAAFCLFASEWFRRAHQQGHWEWRTVFEGLALRPGVWGSAEARSYTLDGLRWWSIDIISTAASRRYLATLVCQGGFPVNTLRNDGAAISRMLRQCLQQYERYQGEPIGAVVDDNVACLPETLHAPEVRHLLGRVVEAVSDLRRKSADAAELGTSRREWLDQELPDWRDLLPFRVEDPEAQSLLLSLLDASKPHACDGHPLSVFTCLVSEGDRLVLQRVLRSPKTIESIDFRRVGGLPTDATLYTRMTGFLGSGATRLQSCRIAQPFQASTLRMEASGVGRVLGADAAKQISFEVRSGSQVVATAALPGGGALPASPWVFSGAEPFGLIGVGSVRTRHSSIYVAVPDSAVLRGDQATEISARIDGRTLYRVSGDAQIEHDDFTYSLHTNQAIETAVVYELRGSSQVLGASGSEVWLGAPDVVELDLAGAAPPRTLRSDEVHWRSGQGGAWRPLGGDCIGEGFVRVEVAGEIRMRTRLTVLPESFRLEITPGPAHDQGQWVFRGIGDAAILVTNNNVSIRQAIVGDDLVADITVAGAPPRTIPARIRFANQRVANLELVCPTESCQIVSAGGEMVDARRGIPIEQLDGMRVRVVQPGNQRPYLVDLKHSLVIDVFQEVTRGVWEYPLSFAEDRAIGLLSESEDRDRVIRLGVFIGRGRSPLLEIKISRYAYGLQPAVADDQPPGDASPPPYSRVQIRDPQLRDSLADESVTLRVIALNDPETLLPDESVSQESPGVWRIDHGDADPGYYLVTGRTASGDVLRPLRIACKRDEFDKPPTDKPEEDYGFDEVSSIGAEARRHAVWDAFFRRVSTDFGDSDWVKVDAVVQASTTLPVTTFEAVAGATRNPIAAARVGLLNPTNAALWRRLEELPFLWCLVPLDAWIRAATRLRRHLRNILSDAGIASERIDEHFERSLGDFVEQGPYRHPAVSCVTLCFFGAQLTNTPPTGISATTDTDYQGALASLISRQDLFDSRQTWPSLRLRYSDEVHRLLHTTPGLLNQETHTNQWAVINAPSIAAIHAVYDIPVNRSQLEDFQLLRFFDTEWFDAAMCYAMSRLAHRRISEQSGWPRAIVEEEGG